MGGELPSSKLVGLGKGVLVVPSEQPIIDCEQQSQVLHYQKGTKLQVRHHSFDHTRTSGTLPGVSVLINY